VETQPVSIFPLIIDGFQVQRGDDAHLRRQNIVARRNLVVLARTMRRKVGEGICAPQSQPRQRGVAPRYQVRNGRRSGCRLGVVDRRTGWDKTTQRAKRQVVGVCGCYKSAHASKTRVSGSGVDVGFW